MPSHEAHTQKPQQQLCIDPLTNRQVFLAPGRAERPIEQLQSDRARRDDPASLPVDAACPFCRGHEELAPPEVLRLPAGASWLARVVPNRYPIVAALPTAKALPSSGETRPACGIHEVLIESPRHDTRVEQVGASTWETAWHAARQRLAALAEIEGLRWAMLFKNAGPRAGASLAHVHSQIVGLEFLPPMIRRKRARLRRSPDQHRRVLTEAERSGRVWAMSEGLVAFVPAAPRQPFESCIMPRDEQGYLAHASAAQVAALARLTQAYARRLSELAFSDASFREAPAGVTGGVDFNWWLHQAPFATNRPLPGWHWHLEILPRLTQLAGFELGSGCHITTQSPREAASLLAGT